MIKIAIDQMPVDRKKLACASLGLLYMSTHILLFTVIKNLLLRSIKYIRHTCFTETPLTECHLNEKTFQAYCYCVDANADFQSRKHLKQKNEYFERLHII
jgi:hypothetical protein